MRVYVAMVAALWVSGCVDSDSVKCSNGQTCPAGTACDEMHAICVEPEQLTACEGLEQAADCTFGKTNTAGKCTETVCLVPECGNKVKDIGEVCEDHNVLDKDGCSSDCKSDETCGNGIVDLAVGEACDDNNRIDNDGCAGTCVIERAQWINASSVRPAGRTLAAMAYDANRDAIVLFGGGGVANQFLSETWEFRGEWTPSATLFAPPPASRAAAAYHHELGRVVVHGGLGQNGSVQGALVQWDGTSWTPRTAPGLVGHAAAYDSRRKRLVAFGGFDEQGNYSDKTLEFDGTTWTEATPATTRPPIHQNAQMTYDPEHGLVLMYGGYSGQSFTPTTDLWAYDGVDWKLLSSGGPPARLGTFFAYHVASHAAILFGGQDQCAMAPCPISGDTWKVTIGPPTVWTKITQTLTSQPSSRAFGSMVADGHGRLVLFGGTEGTVRPDDTWIFDGDWHEVTVPDPRDAGGAALDVVRRQLVVYGGTSGESTWELSDSGWTEHPTLAGTSAPSARVDIGMVYDEKNHKVVAYGGASATATFPSETWLWDGSQAGIWSKASPGTSPPGTRQGQLVYDSKNQRVLLFGPHTQIAANPPTLDQATVALWAWDGSTWTKLQPAHTPPPRLRAVVGFDRRLGQLVMFGGTDGGASLVNSYNDTWVFDGTDWHEAMPQDPTAPRPPPNVVEFTTIGQSQMVWNPVRGRLTLLDANVNVWEWMDDHWQLVETTERPPRRAGYSLVPTRDGHGLAMMFGYGNENQGEDYAPWLLQWSASTAQESCARSTDLDGDGKRGCEDPDCFARCTPLCPPLTSCPTDAPRCGDGTCDPDESCYSCTDCTCGALCGDFVCAGGETSTTCPGDCP